MSKDWVDIPGYEGLYKINAKGEVMSMNYNHTGKNKKLRQCLASIGYPQVVLSRNRTKKAYLTHQLMAITFLGHKPNGHKIQVDHIDGNKQNNHIDNLQLVDARLNRTKDIDKSKTSSKYHGVSYIRKDKWGARTSINGKQRHIGYFATEEEAYKAYLDELNNETD